MEFRKQLQPESFWKPFEGKKHIKEDLKDFDFIFPEAPRTEIQIIKDESVSSKIVVFSNFLTDFNKTGFFNSLKNYGVENCTRSNVIAGEYGEAKGWHRRKTDGKKTTFISKGKRVYSVSFGYRGGGAGAFKPGAFALNNQFRTLYNEVKGICRHASQHYLENSHEEGAPLLNVARKIHQDYLISFPFTTATLNYNFSCSCHFDKRNLKNGYSSMFVLKSDNTLGGELYFPQIKTAVSLPSNSLIFFQSEELLHGNLPLSSTGLEKYHRASFVFYTLENLKGVASRKDMLEKYFQKDNRL